jgi:hypothetical protein
MVLLLLPTMRVGTACLVRAPLIILGNKSSWLPIVAYPIALILIDIWFSPKVLPVVSIDTLGLVVLLVERAPLGLEVEHVKIAVLLHLMDKSRLKILCAVSEGAIVTILTLA